MSDWPGAQLSQQRQARTALRDGGGSPRGPLGPPVVPQSLLVMKVVSFMVRNGFPPLADHANKFFCNAGTLFGSTTFRRGDQTQPG